MMSRWTYFLSAVALLALVITLFGCRTSGPSHISSESWSQDNLKRNDTGCPTAIYIVQDGELILCPPT
jgi:hypothetical protein